ncbi:tyrosine-type recombinase/integrase [Actinomadura chokoriensis]|uniref:Tyrosine-type recombinase/integrase n=1 Tax=Actinomadura chokoriensis TaxID=454156 RepID=A0ABV4R9Z9_9ACTN
MWIGPDGKECTKAFRIQDAAKKYARKQEEDIERGEYIDPAAGKELLQPLGRKWLRLQSVGLTSRERYEGVLRLHIEPTFGHRKVKSVKPSEVAEWLRALSKTHGHSIQSMAFHILSGMFALAVADGVRRDNPAQSDIITKPAPTDDEPREAWTGDRVWAVISAHPAEYELIPVLQAGCGLRESEAFAIGEEDLDLDAGKVVIRRQVARVRTGKRYVFKLPKGGKTRVVPLSPGVVRAVRAYIETYPPRPYALPWLDEHGQVTADEHVCKLLFRWHGDDPRTHGQHIRESSYNRQVWKPALVKAGVIPEPEKGPRGGASRKYRADRADGTHALRHYYSTTLQDAGVSLAGVMAFLGHSRNKRHIPISVRVYGHVTEETFEAARNAIDRSLFRLRPVQDHQADGTETEQAVSQ